MNYPEKDPQGAIEKQPPTKVAVVAPVWLIEALSILLKSATNIELLASALSVAELLAEHLETAPDLVLIDGKRELDQAYDQVSQVKAHWPGTFCVILVDHIRQQKVLKAAGADQILVKGVSSQRLLSAIRQVEAGRSA